MKYGFIIFGFLLILSTSCSWSQEDSAFTSKTDSAFISADSAVVLALKYTGFEKMKGFSTKANFDAAELVVINDDKSPFLHDRINGRELWKVTFKDVQLSFESKPVEQEKFEHKFNVLIDPVSGQLLKIYSKYTGDVQDFLPEPSIEWTEQQLKGSTEIFLDFPDSNGYISFYDALNSHCPPSVKEISAHLAIVSRPLNKPQVVWSTTFRGLPVGFFPKGNQPIYYENYIRMVYDAVSGKLMYFTTLPTVNPADTVYLTK